MAKIATAARLVARGDWKLIARQARSATALWRLRLHGEGAFVHGDLGFPAVCHPDWPDSLDQFSGLHGDHWEMSLMRRWLRPGDAVFDIGANLGLYSFAASDAVGPGGMVVGVDADAFIVEKLRIAAGLLKSPQLQALHSAISDQSGSVEFYIQSGRSITGEQSMRPSEQQMETAVRVVSPALSMRDLVHHHAGPRVVGAIKLDIEGAESLAFKAVPEELLRADGPLWIVEIHPGALRRFGAVPGDITSHFSAADFKIFVLAKHPLGPDSALAALRPLASDESFSESLYYNLLAVPRGPKWQDRRSAIGDMLPCT